MTSGAYCFPAVPPFRPCCPAPHVRPCCPAPTRRRRRPRSARTAAPGWSTSIRSTRRRNIAGVAQQVVGVTAARRALVCPPRRGPGGRRRRRTGRSTRPVRERSPAAPPRRCGWAAAVTRAPARSARGGSGRPRTASTAAAVRSAARWAVAYRSFGSPARRPRPRPWWAWASRSSAAGGAVARRRTGCTSPAGPVVRSRDGARGGALPGGRAQRPSQEWGSSDGRGTGHDEPPVVADGSVAVCAHRGAHH